VEEDLAREKAAREDAEKELDALREETRRLSAEALEAEAELAEKGKECRRCLDEQERLAGEGEVRCLLIVRYVCRLLELLCRV
jgi:hypothetical protein